MTTKQLQKEAMQVIRDKSFIQPLAHTIGMDYPDGFCTFNGQRLFFPHRNHFAIDFGRCFKSEFELGYVKYNNGYYSVTEKGIAYLEDMFDVTIVKRRNSLW